MNWQVGIKNTTVTKRVRAKTELEAKTKFCEQQGFAYRVYANKIEAKKDGKK